MGGGPDLGPAVLFWGVVLVVILVAAVLGRVSSTPLQTCHWILVGLGLSAAFVFTAPLVVAWFFAMGWRRKFGEPVNPRIFNLVIRFYWLGNYPDMQIAGNDSSAWVPKPLLKPRPV